MDQYVKYQSVQGGAFTSSQNLVDFRIPMSGVYDLRDSFINLNCTLDVTDKAAQAAVGTAIYDFNGEWVSADAEKLHFQNVACVKNAVLDCAKQGRIENLRRCDILRQNLATYTKTQMEDVDESYLDFAQFKAPISRQQYGQFAQLNKLGTNKSRYNTQTQIPIRLSDVFEFCRVREYDTDKAGETHIHLELNRDKLQVRQVMKDADIHPAAVKQMIDTPAGVATSNNLLVVGASSGTTPLKFTDLNQSPYYVGQMLLVTATHTDGGADDRADAPAIVNSVTWDKDTGSLSLTFEQAWGVPIVAGKAYTAISVKIGEVDSVALNVDTAEIVLRRVNNPEGVGQINYNTYSTEETNGNGQTTFQNLFTIEPEATNIMCMFPDSADGLLSVNNDITSWRLRLNNEDLTDRDVSRKSPLAYDRLAMTLNSMGEGLSNLVQNPGETTAANWGATFTQTAFDNILIGNPLFQTQQQKLLQLNINSGGTGVKKLVLYKQLPRVFSY